MLNINDDERKIVNMSSKLNVFVQNSAIYRILPMKQAIESVLE